MFLYTYTYIHPNFQLTSQLTTFHCYISLPKSLPIYILLLPMIFVAYIVSLWSWSVSSALCLSVCLPSFCCMSASLIFMIMNTVVYAQYTTHLCSLVSEWEHVHWVHLWHFSVTFVDSLILQYPLFLSSNPSCEILVMM